MSSSIEDRDELFKALQLGRMNPEEAENLAAGRGWAPLNPDPASNPFDVMQEYRWTIAMALAWIMLRRSDAVREFWPVWWAVTRKWVRIDWRYVDPEDAGRGYGLEFVGPKVSPIADLGSRFSSESILPLERAKGVLWSELSNGKLRAFASKGDSWSEIPPRDWESIAVIEGSARSHDRHRDQFGIPSRKGATDIGEIHVLRRDIIALWPAEKAPIPVPRKPEKEGLMDDLVAGAIAAKGDTAFRLMSEKERYHYLSEWIRARGVRAPARTTLQKTLKRLGALQPKRASESE